MAINPINSQVYSNQPKESSTITRTAIAAGIGAGIAGTSEYFAQRNIIKNPIKAINKILKSGDSYRGMKGWEKIIKVSDENRLNDLYLLQRVGIKVKKIVVDKTGKALKAYFDRKNTILKNGKIVGFKNLKLNWPVIGKVGAIGAGITAGAYLLYKGIKNAFN